MWWRCSSQVWMKIMMPSNYTNTNELENGRKMSLISLMKAMGAFVRLKGMTNHSKSSLVQIGTQLVLSQCLEDLLDVVEVLFPSLAKYRDVIHQSHEGCRSIRQLERNEQPFKNALLGFECGLPHIGQLDRYLVIPRI